MAKETSNGRAVASRTAWRGQRFAWLRSREWRGCGWRDGPRSASMAHGRDDLVLPPRGDSREVPSGPKVRWWQSGNEARELELDIGGKRNSRYVCISVFLSMACLPPSGTFLPEENHPSAPS